MARPGQGRSTASLSHECWYLHSLLKTYLYSNQTQPGHMTAQQIKSLRTPLGCSKINRAFAFITSADDFITSAVVFITILSTHGNPPPYLSFFVCTAKPCSLVPLSLCPFVPLSLCPFVLLSFGPVHPFYLVFLAESLEPLVSQWIPCS